MPRLINVQSWGKKVNLSGLMFESASFSMLYLLQNYRHVRYLCDIVEVFDVHPTILKSL